VSTDIQINGPFDFEAQWVTGAGGFATLAITAPGTRCVLLRLTRDDCEALIQAGIEGKALLETGAAAQDGGQP